MNVEMKATDAEMQRRAEAATPERADAHAWPRGDAATAQDTHAATDVSSVAVSINHLAKTYPVPLARLKQFFRRKSAQPVEALRDVTFAINTGEVFGLIGRNGAGKTTLTKIIATLVQPTSGAVSVRGFDSVRDEAEVRAQIGLASAEERSFYWRLTAEQNLVFFARLYGLSDRTARRRIAELLSLIELEEVARRRFGELSTGNKQRMAVARALLNSPPVLLLDEPTRSLDPLAASRMRALIGSLARGTPPVTILLTSHNLPEIEELCERIAVISRGRIRATGTPASLRSLHRQQERVRITLRGISQASAQHVLAEASAQTDLVAEGENLLVTLTRDPADDSLDETLHLLMADGARVVSCETESATLLDVLESYEDEEKAEAEGLKGESENGKQEEGARR